MTFKNRTGLLLCSLLLVTLANVSSPLWAAPLPAVTVAVIEQRTPLRSLYYLGRIEAIQAVDITTRTEGFIARRDFSEGQMVKAGDPLFEIDSALHQAAVAQAQAQLDSAKATARLAQLNLSRQQRLGEQRSVSRADVDASQAQRDTSGAAVAQAEANLRIQRLQLGFTLIAAPIAGRIGHSNFSVGSLINPASGSLAHLVQLDPIRVAIAINERDYIAAANRKDADADDFSHSGYTPHLQLANGMDYPEPGVFESVDNRIDSQTGTVTVRARFANPRHLLLPGGVVNVTLTAGRADPVVMAPIAALQQNREGFFVLLVDKENRVEVRPVVIGDQFEQEYQIKQGLAAGDRVIVEGLQRVRPGMVVDATTAATASLAPVDPADGD
ncbi:efflux RND transporter periplasmic adaptor subunit [Sodalis ligni]|jgi:RND family efflux transporter MFP subunit|uniref:RND family efflux transporter MFP subunit n=1 Tax=Sodalis ligni TaxID=2697027 RepID=A0A4V2Q2T5_9GAMM|nr:efflux RND transporter periplasmic adaptor subunit [Sodalis ligni]TCL04048.1 RND family efflux transporter MFP subunit [Sodalis ligni]